jgi:protease-4
MVIRINSPGGTVTASDIIYQELKRFKKKNGIKTVACMMDLATSGGYMAAVACDKILAHPTSVTGSIGVIALKINASGLLEKIGVENETMKAGEKKDFVSPLRGMTQEEREIIQKVLDELHQQFMERVAAGRKELNLEQVKALSDGRIFTAHQALEHKLIDRVGYLEDALELAKGEANLKEAKVVVYHRPYGYRNNIYSQLPSAPLPTINLVNLELGSLLKGGGLSFMYLWMP